MDRMRGSMMEIIADPNPCFAFVHGVITSCQGTIDMAKTVLMFRKDPLNQRFAHEIIEAQTHEIQDMRGWLRQHGIAE